MKVEVWFCAMHFKMNSFGAVPGVLPHKLMNNACVKEALASV